AHRALPGAQDQAAPVRGGSPAPPPRTGGAPEVGAGPRDRLLRRLRPPGLPGRGGARARRDRLLGPRPALAPAPRPRGAPGPPPRLREGARVPRGLAHGRARRVDRGGDPGGVLRGSRRAGPDRRRARRPGALRPLARGRVPAGRGAARARGAAARRVLTDPPTVS